MKPCKHQKSKQRCQDLCWKVQDHAHYFVLCLYTTCMHEHKKKSFYGLVPQYGVLCKQLLCFVHSQGQKSKQNPTTKKFVRFHNRSPLFPWMGFWSITGLPPALPGKFVSTHWVKRGSVSVLPKNTTQCPQPALKPRWLDSE